MRCPQAQLRWLGSKNQWTLLLHFVIEARPFCKWHSNWPLHRPLPRSLASFSRTMPHLLPLTYDRPESNTLHSGQHSSDPKHSQGVMLKTTTTPRPAAYPLAVMRCLRGIVRVTGIRSRVFHHAALELVVADVQPPQVLLVRARRLVSSMRLCAPTARRPTVSVHVSRLCSRPDEPGQQRRTAESLSCHLQGPDAATTNTAAISHRLTPTSAAARQSQ